MSYTNLFIGPALLDPRALNPCKMGRPALKRSRNSRVHIVGNAATAMDPSRLGKLIDALQTASSNAGADCHIFLPGLVGHKASGVLGRRSLTNSKLLNVLWRSISSERVRVHIFIEDTAAYVNRHLRRTLVKPSSRKAPPSWSTFIEAIRRELPDNFEIFIWNTERVLASLEAIEDFVGLLHGSLNSLEPPQVSSEELEANLEAFGISCERLDEQFQQDLVELHRNHILVAA